MKILVGSENPVKILAVEEAFNNYFENIEVIGISVPSQVAEQPVNRETFQGAQNRATALFVLNKEKGLNADFFIGIEGGIIETYDIWFGLGCMCIINKEGIHSLGTSPHFPLPHSMVRQMLEGKELGHIMDEETGDVDTKRKHGAIGVFTRGVITRKDLYVSGLISALIPFIDDGKYFDL